jgi:hypothetical protein
MQIWSTNSGWWQVFKYENNQFINWSNNKVVEVKGSKDEEMAAVGVFGNNNGRNQQWQVVYVDKADGPQTQGLNKEFGMHCDRLFYIVSELPFNRVIEMHGNTYTYLKRWRNNATQQ